MDASLVAQTVKHQPTMRETQVRSLGQEDPLEKETATHSNIHAWKIPWTEEPGGLQSMGSQRVGHNWATLLHFTSTLMTDKWRGTIEPLDEGERGGWKGWLKTQCSENSDHGLCPITSWQIEGEKVETVTDFIFLGSKITADGDSNHEITRCLLLGTKAMTKT